MRDDTPFGGPTRRRCCSTTRATAPAHPVEHLETFAAGILQADIYVAYNAHYADGRSPGAVIETPCWSHARRKFFALADIAANAHRGKTAPSISPVALEAVKRIDTLFDIDREEE